jgi:hypothetical protein
MPDLPDRETYERSVTGAVLDVFARYSDRNRFDAERFGNDIAAAVVEPLREIRQRAIIAMLILLSDDSQADLCGPLHGTTQNRWPVGPPPAHPRCRCYLVYSVTRMPAGAR